MLSVIMTLYYETGSGVVFYGNLCKVHNNSMNVLCKYFFLFLYVKNSSRHSPETFPSPVKTVVWIGLLRLNTHI